jgi:hypothetical protein
LLGGRVLELAREVHGRAWRLNVVQQDGKDRRQVGGFDLPPDELRLFLVSVSAMGAYARGASRGWRVA